MLDAGIGLFDPGVDSAARPGKGIYREVRLAEARYLPFRLSQVLQTSGLWAAVRVLPNHQREMDVHIDGRIIKSDSRILILEITVCDSSGKLWFKKKYEDLFASTPQQAFAKVRQAPYYNIYLAISRDLAETLSGLSDIETGTIKSITGLKFAQQFAPDIFSGYLTVNKRERISIRHLPATASDDWKRIMRVRNRDSMFIDILQNDYADFADKMESPYVTWLQESYRERLMLTSMKEQANSRILSGILKLFSSLNPLSPDRFGNGGRGPVGFAAGKAQIQDGLAKRREARMHIAGLEELADSLSSELHPHVINLDNRTVKLSGSVQEQYEQWQKILYQIYQVETGDEKNKHSN